MHAPADPLGMQRTVREILSSDTDLWAGALQAVLLAAVLLPGTTAWAGPVLLTLAPTRGVHLGDLVVVALWLVVLVAAVQRGLVRELLARVPSAPGAPVSATAAALR